MQHVQPYCSVVVALILVLVPTWVLPWALFWVVLSGELPMDHVVLILERLSEWQVVRL